MYNEPLSSITSSQFGQSRELLSAVCAVQMGKLVKRLKLDQVRESFDTGLENFTFYYGIVCRKKDAKRRKRSKLCLMTVKRVSKKNRSMLLAKSSTVMLCLKDISQPRLINQRARSLLHICSRAIWARCWAKICFSGSAETAIASKSNEEPLIS